MICGMCLLFLCCVTYHPHLVVNKEGSCSQTNIYTLISAPTENLVQWNPSNPDTMGPQKVLISGVEKFKNVVFGTTKTVFYIEVYFRVS